MQWQPRIALAAQQRGMPDYVDANLRKAIGCQADLRNGYTGEQRHAG
jgi:hypothetical protein